MEENINLESLFSNNGNNKEDWNYFATNIKKEEYSEKIIENLSHYLKRNDQDKVSLALYITDYILDFGCPKIISLIAQQNFLEDILDLIRSETNANVINQKTVIYLIQKWAKKFQKNKELDSFQKNFTMLQDYGMEFPDPNFSMDTYHKYIAEEQQNENLNQNIQPQNNPQENKQMNNNENMHQQVPNKFNESQQPQKGVYPLVQNSENNNQPSQFQGADNKNINVQSINQGPQNDFKQNPFEENSNNNNNNILRSKVHRNENIMNNQNINENNINNQNPDSNKPVPNMNINNKYHNPFFDQNNINNDNHNMNGCNFNQNNLVALNNYSIK